METQNKLFITMRWLARPWLHKDSMMCSLSWSSRGNQLANKHYWRWQTYELLIATWMGQAWRRWKVHPGTCLFPSIMIVCDMMWWSQILGVSTLLPLWFQIQLCCYVDGPSLKKRGDGGHHSDGTPPIPVDHDHIWYAVGECVITAMVNPSHLLIVGQCKPCPPVPSSVVVSSFRQPAMKMRMHLGWRGPKLSSLHALSDHRFRCWWPLQIWGQWQWATRDSELSWEGKGVALGHWGRKTQCYRDVLVTSIWSLRVLILVLISHLSVGRIRKHLWRPFQSLWKRLVTCNWTWSFVLNLYSDLKLKSSWIDASVIVARIEDTIFGSGYSASSSLGSFLSTILASWDGTSLRTKIFHRAFRLCSCLTQRATISLWAMFLNWSQA